MVAGIGLSDSNVRPKGLKDLTTEICVDRETWRPYGGLPRLDVASPLHFWKKIDPRVQ